MDVDNFNRELSWLSLGCLGNHGRVFGEFQVLTSHFIPFTERVLREQHISNPSKGYQLFVSLFDFDQLSTHHSHKSPLRLGSCCGKGENWLMQAVRALFFDLQSAERFHSSQSNYNFAKIFSLDFCEKITYSLGKRRGMMNR